MKPKTVLKALGIGLGVGTLLGALLMLSGPGVLQSTFDFPPIPNSRSQG